MDQTIYPYTSPTTGTVYHIPWNKSEPPTDEDFKALESMIAAQESQKQQQTPTSIANRIASQGADAMTTPAMKEGNRNFALKALPVATSAVAAGLSGGLSFPLQLAIQGGAGLASGMGRSALGDQGGMGKNMAVDAVTNMGAPVVGKALRAIAPSIMEGALRINAPLARKFGADRLGATALENRILPTASGAQKAADLGRGLSADKSALLAAADQRVSMVPGVIAPLASHDVVPAVTDEMRAGVRPQGSVPSLAGDFVAANPQGMTPTELDRAKSVWDDISNADRRKVYIGGRIGADEKMPIALAASAKTGLEQAAPGYSDINRRIMNMKGVQLAAQGRADIPARGLDNLATGYGTAEALAHGDPKTALTLAAVRAARVPAIMGGSAIGMNELGKTLLKPGAPPTAEALRAAILALMQQQQGPQ